MQAEGSMPPESPADGSVPRPPDSARQRHTLRRTRRKNSAMCFRAISAVSPSRLPAARGREAGTGEQHHEHSSRSRHRERARLDKRVDRVMLA
jgi:hypothetical protein